jgi:hypothetical protein
MKLSKITFTGADDKVDRQQLYNISDVNSRVEWGILVYPKRYGELRYPSLKWIGNFLRYKPDFVQTSAHLCGTAIHGFISNPKYRERMSNFDRVQLNVGNYYNILNPNVFIGSIMDFTDEYSKPVILQYNKSNHDIIDHILRFVDVNILFDSSRGKGIVNFDIKSHLLDDPYSGYAGGITSENIRSVMKILDSMYDKEQRIWIDTESGIRTNNEFDIDKIMLILNQLYGDKY